MPTARGAGLAAQLPLFDAGALVAAAPPHPLCPPTTGLGRLVALSFGAGQESTTLLYLHRYSASFRARYVPDGRLVVIFCDTGDEHANTYAHVTEVAQFCAASAIPFVHIRGDMGYHTGHWRDGLVGQFRATRTVMGLAFPKSCSDQLKISPFYKYLEAYVAREYSLGEATRKQALYRYARLYGPLRVLIGFAAGEERRLARAGAATTIPRSRPRTTRPLRRTTPPARWMQRCMERAYPLIDLGMTRADCQTYIRAVGHTAPPPSLCRRCPFSTLRELW